MKARAIVGSVLLVVAVGCGSSKKHQEVDGGLDGGAPDGSTASDGGGGDAGSVDGGGGGQAALVKRGRYLVVEVAKCVDCHSPAPNPSTHLVPPNKLLSGNDCFADTPFGCITTPNLTDDDTGLKKFTDAEIKDAFLNGKRPGGGDADAGVSQYLFNIMPYFVFHNMSDADADAIVAFLRSVPGVKHQVAPNHAPFAQNKPADPAPIDTIPAPDSSDAHFEEAKRGRYLAANVGVCLECHTQEKQITITTPGGSQQITDSITPRQWSKAFQGGNKFSSAQLGLPAGYPADIYSMNLTSDMTSGLGTWTVAQIVRALKKHVDEKGEPLCLPMPFFKGLTDQDALDIAYYLKSLPAAKTNWPECTPPGVDAGVTGDAGADAGADAG